MKATEPIRNLIDELAVFSVLVQDVPEPYKTIIDKKIIGFNAYLSKVLTIETERHNDEFLNSASELLTELEIQQFEK